MRTFFDTSVLMAAFWRGHPSHESSVKLVGAADRTHAACSVHTLAEVYAGMTVLPVKPVIPPEQVMLFIQEVRDRFTLVTLDDTEYFDTMQRASESGLTSGRIYDALLLRCASKIKAATIYTWNVKHFRAIAPELAGRIRTP